MTERICDWCDAPATVRHRRTDEDEAACEEHRRELWRALEARIALSGNPFAGEAAEASLEEII